MPKQRLMIIKTDDGQEHTFIIDEKELRKFKHQLQKDYPEGISDMEKGH